METADVQVTSNETFFVLNRWTVSSFLDRFCGLREQSIAG